MNPQFTIGLAFTPVSVQTVQLISLWRCLSASGRYPTSSPSGAFMHITFATPFSCTLSHVLHANLLLAHSPLPSLLFFLSLFSLSLSISFAFFSSYSPYYTLFHHRFYPFQYPIDESYLDMSVLAINWRTQKCFILSLTHTTAPSFELVRPCDGNETVGAYVAAIEHNKTPVCISLSRQVSEYFLFYSLLF